MEGTNTGSGIVYINFVIIITLLYPRERGPMGSATYIGQEWGPNFFTIKLTMYKGLIKPYWTWLNKPLV